MQIRRREANTMSTSECQKVANITIVSTTLLIGLNIKSYEIFACILIPFFLTNLVIAKSRLSQSNTEILCAERVKL